MTPTTANNINDPTMATTGVADATVALVNMRGKTPPHVGHRGARGPLDLEVGQKP